MGIRVLLADDDDDLQFLTQMALSEAGFDVVCVSNGKEVIESAASEKFDVVLLDAEMPVMNGFEAYRLLRSNPRTADVPVIFLTARTPDEAMKNRSEPLHFILKPFDAEELPQKIRAIVQAKKL